EGTTSKEIARGPVDHRRRVTPLPTRYAKLALEIRGPHDIRGRRWGLARLKRGVRGPAAAPRVDEALALEQLPDCARARPPRGGILLHRLVPQLLGAIARIALTQGDNPRGDLRHQPMAHRAGRVRALG